MAAHPNIPPEGAERSEKPDEERKNSPANVPEALANLAHYRNLPPEAQSFAVEEFCRLQAETPKEFRDKISPRWAAIDAIEAARKRLAEQRPPKPKPSSAPPPPQDKPRVDAQTADKEQAAKWDREWKKRHESRPPPASPKWDPDEVPETPWNPDGMTRKDISKAAKRMIRARSDDRKGLGDKLAECTREELKDAINDQGYYCGVWAWHASPIEREGLFEELLDAVHQVQLKLGYGKDREDFVRLDLNRGWEAGLKEAEDTPKTVRKRSRGRRRAKKGVDAAAKPTESAPAPKNTLTEAQTGQDANEKAIRVLHAAGAQFVECIGKRPTKKWKGVYITADEAVEAWRNPKRNLALVPGSVNLLVVDVDGGDQTGFLAALAAVLLDEHVPYAILTSLSGRGKHVYVRVDVNTRGGPWDARGASGDLRCLGGYVVLAPGATLSEIIRLLDGNAITAEAICGFVGRRMPAEPPPKPKPKPTPKAKKAAKPKADPKPQKAASAKRHGETSDQVTRRRGFVQGNRNNYLYWRARVRVNRTQSVDGLREWLDQANLQLASKWDSVPLREAAVKSIWRSVVQGFERGEIIVGVPPFDPAQAALGRKRSLETRGNQSLERAKEADELVDLDMTNAEGAKRIGISVSQYKKLTTEKRRLRKERENRERNRLREQVGRGVAMGLNQRQIADFVGVNQSTISRLISEGDQG